MKIKILLFALLSIIISANATTQTNFEIFGVNEMINTRAVVLSDTGYVNTNQILNHQNSFSWFCWVNTTSTYPYGYIMSSYKTDGSSNCRMQMRSSGIIRAYFNLGGGAVSLDSPIAINDGKDHFIGVVMNRTDGYCTIWIDGEPVSSVVITSEHDQPMDTDTPFCIGTKNTIQLYCFKGIIDDVQVFDGNVTGQNIIDLYNNGDRFSCGDPRHIRSDILIGYWRFNEQVRLNTINEVSSEVGSLINEVSWIRE